MKISMKLYFEAKRRWVGDFELPERDEGMRDFVDDIVRYNHDRNEAEIKRFMSLMRLQAGLNEQDPCIYELTIMSSMGQFDKSINHQEEYDDYQ